MRSMAVPILMLALSFTAPLTAAERHVEDFAPILSAFSSGGFTETQVWEEPPYRLEFEPLLGNPAFEVHGIMRLHVPRSRLAPGEPDTLTVRGLAGGGGAWFMLHHFSDTDAFVSTGVLRLPSGRRLLSAPCGSLFKAPHPIAWSGPFLLGSDLAGEAEDVFHVRARLRQQNGEEKTLVRDFHTRARQRRVEIVLWPSRDVDEGTHLLQLVVEDEHGGELARWQGRVVVHHMQEFLRRKSQAERLAADLPR